MKFFNETPLAARLMRSAEADDRLRGAVIARASFRIERGRLVPIDDVLWPVGPEPLETPFGELLGDAPFLTGGVDVIVVGKAYAPNARPGPTARVDARVGPRFRRSIAVFGERRWIRPDGKLVPSEPLPFTAMPLTYENAFGGKPKMEDGGEFPYPHNHAGKGFYLDDAQAEGQPLPNLEDPDALITSHSDRPDPVGTAPYPITGALRAQRAAVLHEDPATQHGIKKLKPLLFNKAHPRMVIPPKDAPKAGDLVELTSVRPAGDLRFEVPDVPTHAEVKLAERVYRFPLHLDLIAVLAEEMRVVLGFRTVFRYRMLPRERRTTTLRAGQAPPAGS